MAKIPSTYCIFFPSHNFYDAFACFYPSSASGTLPKLLPIVPSLLCRLCCWPAGFPSTNNKLPSFIMARRPGEYPTEFCFDTPDPAAAERVARHAYSGLPSPNDFTSSLKSFEEPKALQDIWESLRAATFDYSARSQCLRPAHTMIVEKVFLVLREISCWRLPGTTIAKRHRGLMPREEFSRRDRCVLAFDQDQNAIAALTGPIARLLGRKSNESSRKATLMAICACSGGVQGGGSVCPYQAGDPTP